MKDQPVIFITGTGRSGTNILKKILGQHSAVASLPFEHRFTIDPRGIVDFYNTFPSLWSPYWVDYKTKDLEDFLLDLASISTEKAERIKATSQNSTERSIKTPPPYAGWELDRWIPGYSDAVRELIESFTEFDYPAIWPGAREGIDDYQMNFAQPLTKANLRPHLSEFLYKCHRAICSSQNREVFVEDNTHSLLFANDLFDLVPNSKLIHVMRDPKDVVASLIRQKWAPNKVEQAVIWYKSIIKQWEVQKALCNPESVLEIRMEALVQDTEQTLSTICTFANLPFEKKMLEVDLSQGNIGRNEVELSQNDQALMKRLLG